MNGTMTEPEHVRWVARRALGTCPRDGQSIFSFADVWRHINSQDYGHGIEEPLAEGSFEPAGFEEEDHQAEERRLMAEFIDDAQTILGEHRDIAVDSMVVFQGVVRDYIRALEQAGFIVLMSPSMDYSVWAFTDQTELP